MKNKSLKISADRGKIIRRIAVFGAGRSGLAVIKRLQGFDLFLSENKARIEPEAIRLLKRLGVHYELGGHTQNAISGRDLIVVSPGVHLDIPILKKAERAGIPIISEIELAYNFLKKPIIAVTGTNGKTTTTTLIGRMLKDGGFRAAVAGNIGFPLISVDDKKLDYVVAEISSYQLEAIRKFRPRISLILNITEDHLTRHGSMKEYSALKAAIFRNQGKNDLLIYNIDDPRVRQIVRKAGCAKIPFSRKIPLSKGICVKGGSVYFDKVRICGTDEVKIKGEHNLENALAAAGAAMLCRVSPASIRRTLMSFRGVEHRIEFVRRSNGISYYNDSKGTNPDSTIVAIRTLKPSHDLILILGGRDKMTDLKEMCRTVKDNAKEVVLIGEARKRFRKCLSAAGFNNIHEAGSLRDAVVFSKRIAKPGDAVLLSPACASFDMFSNYEERGKVFKQIVSKL